jgi:hypothetical protein
MEPIGYIPPARAGANYHRQFTERGCPGLTHTNEPLKKSRGNSSRFFIGYHHDVQPVTMVERQAAAENCANTSLFRFAGQCQYP